MKADVKASPEFANRLCVLILVSIAFAFALLPARAFAAPEFFWKVPGSGEIGSESGQFDHPEGIAVNPTSGHLYIADNFNRRVDEYDAWGQFVKAWGWGVADGSSELQTCGPEATPPTQTCLVGSGGTGPGQFGGGTPAERRGPEGGIVVDAVGDIYVGDMVNHRVQKFDPAGNFLLMFGGDVNKGPSHPGDVCTAAHVAEGDTCGAGLNAEGDGQFSFGAEGSHIAVGPAGTVFVGDDSTWIQEFEPNGVFKSKVSIDSGLGLKGTISLAVDGSGNLVVKAFRRELEVDNEHIYKINPGGTLLSTFTAQFAPATPIALDSVGNLYAVVAGKPEEPGNLRWEVVEFSPDGVPLVAPGAGFAVQEGSSSQDTAVSIAGLAVNAVTAAGDSAVYLTATSARTFSFAAAYGPPPDKWAPPAKPPQITSQYAVSVDGSEALVRAQINPLFWADTRYYVEWGTGKCSDGGCIQQQPASPGALLRAGVFGNLATTKGILLSGLSPGTTYHYRFVAQSGGGGPVRGVGPGEAEGTFTTPPPPDAPNASCPNRAFREGVSTGLPDCRAYEMVSPVDKNGGDVVGLCSIQCYSAELNQAAPDGASITYSSYKAFGGSGSGRYTSQYIASRGPDGWSTEGISPPYSSGLYAGPVTEYEFLLDSEFAAFTDDLSRAWLVDSSLTPLTSDGMVGFVNAYREDTVDGSLTALTTTQPEFTQSISNQLEIQGHTPDGEEALLSATAALTPDAAPVSQPQLYLSSNGQLHLVSVLPDGTANPTGAVAGSSFAGGRAVHGAHTLSHAISDDGSRVFWSLAGSGKLYIRLNPAQPQSALSPGGKCTQPSKACTYPVSSNRAQLWTAKPDGSEVLFSEGDPSEHSNGKADLYSYDTTTKTASLVAHKSLGVLGASEDLSRIYFASTEALAPGAVAGERNLYLDEEGSMTFVAVLSRGDTEPGFGSNAAASAVAPRPVNHAVRVSPDGSHIAFMSTNSLTGYDNADVENGKADNEVYLYDADAKELSCVSCDPSGARPEGDELKGPYQRVGSAGYHTGVWAGAWLNTSESSFHSAGALSEDGTRLFFNSFDALVPRDVNGAQDVYEWEAPGSGDCTTASASFAAQDNGCLSLISSGESPEDSVFVDATPDGSDVFFKTTSSLDPSDPGLIDIYDAREGGGFPPPPVPAPPCAGDACQSVPAAPLQQTAASEGFRGAGDLRPSTKPRPRCRARKGSTRSKRQTKQTHAKRCKRAKRKVRR